jgi:hypothetical protein
MMFPLCERPCPTKNRRRFGDSSERKVREPEKRDATRRVVGDGARA